VYDVSVYCTSSGSGSRSVVARSSSSRASASGDRDCVSRFVYEELEGAVPGRGHETYFLIS
jgi:hypothetical protein